jgi:DNA-binding NarL/FixJ family response regulator
MDGTLVTRLMSRPRIDPTLEALSSRERAVLDLMAQGRSNLGIAESLYLSPKTVETHAASVFTKLNIPAGTADNRRVLAVFSWLRAEQ